MSDQFSLTLLPANLGHVQDPTLPPLLNSVPVTEAEGISLLGRLDKPLPAFDSVKAFTRPPSELPPTLAQLVATAFPPPEALEPENIPDLAKITADAAAKPITIVSIHPSGQQVREANKIQITFSNEVIPVTSSDEAAALARDLVEISPPIADATYRFAGPRVLEISSPKLLPFATTFTVAVKPATAPSGARVVPPTEAHSFSTMTNRIVAVYPNHDATPDTPLVFRFELPLPDVVVQSPERLISAEDAPFSLASVQYRSAEFLDALQRLAPREAHAFTSEGTSKDTLELARLRRSVVVMKPRSPLADGGRRYSFAADAPCAEGPLVGDRTTCQLTTYRPLQLHRDGELQEPGNAIASGRPWDVSFSNLVDFSTVTAESFSITTESAHGSTGTESVTFEVLADPIIAASRGAPTQSPYLQDHDNPWAARLGQGLPVLDSVTDGSAWVKSVRLRVRGVTPDVTYKVHVAENVRDIFGQRLTGARWIAIRIGRSPRVEPQILCPTDRTLCLDPRRGPLVVPIIVRIFPEVTVDVFRYTDAAWASTWNSNESDLTMHPGLQLVSSTVRTTDAPTTGAISRVDIDLSSLTSDPSLPRGALLLRVGPTANASRAAAEAAGDEVPNSGGIAQRIRQHTALTKIFISTIGVVAMATRMKDDTVRVAAWAVDACTGAPVPGAEIRAAVEPAVETEWRADAEGSRPFHPLKLIRSPEALGNATTNISGVAIFATRALPGTHGGIVILAKLPDGSIAAATTYTQDAPKALLVGVGFSDRGLYKPKEKVSAAVVIRRRAVISSPEPKDEEHWLHHFTETALEVPTVITDLVAKVFDPHGAELGTYTPVYHAQSGVLHVEAPLPDSVNTGGGRISFEFRDPSASGERTIVDVPFQVQEFRTPAYKVTAGALTDGPVVVPYTADVDVGVYVDAALYAGGGLSGAAISWTARTEESFWVPPGWSAFTFHEYTPWLCWWSRSSRVNVDIPRVTTSIQGSAADSDGHSEVTVRLHGALQRPLQVTTEGSVLDADSQRQFASTSFTALPSDVAIGFKIVGETRFLRSGKALEVELVAVDKDGKLARHVETMTVAVSGEGYHPVVGSNGIAVATRRSFAENFTIPLEGGRTTWTFSAPWGGNFSFGFTGVDARGQAWTSRLEKLYVEGGAAPPGRDEGVSCDPFGDPFSRPVFRNIEIVTDKQTYRVGDTATVLINPTWESNSTPTHVFVWIPVQGDIAGAQHISIPKGTASATVSIPITRAAIPSLEIHALGVSGDEAIDATAAKAAVAAALRRKGLPVFGTCMATLEVAVIETALEVTVEPSSEIVPPGSRVVFSGTVRPPSPPSVEVDTQRGGTRTAATGVGGVDGGYVVLVAVDEAVTDLAGYDLAATSFASELYARRFGTGCVTHNLDNQSALVGLDPRVDDPAFTELEVMESAPTMMMFGGGAMNLRMMRAAPMMAKMAGGVDMAMAMADDGAAQQDAGPAISVRTNFNPQAAFVVGAAVEPSSGAFEVEVTLPDNLTSYRVWAVAATAGSFAVGSSRVTAQLPLMIRPSLPRCLTFGDEAFGAVTLQSLANVPIEVLVAARAAGVSVSAAAAQRVSVPAKGRGLVRIPLAASVGTGEAIVQLAVSTGAGSTISFADSVDAKVLVLAPLTADTFAAYGSVSPDSKVSQDDATRAAVSSLVVPGGALADFGGLSVATSTTAVAELTDSVESVWICRWDWTVVLAQRLLVALSVGPVQEAFNGSTALSGPTGPTGETLSDLVTSLVKRWSVSGKGFLRWENESPQSCYPDIAGSLLATAALATALAAHRNDTGPYKGTIHAAARFENVIREAALITTAPEVIQELAATAVPPFSEVVVLSHRGLGVWARAQCAAAGLLPHDSATLADAPTVISAAAKKIAEGDGTANEILLQAALYAAAVTTDAAAAATAWKLVSPRIVREASCADVISTTTAGLDGAAVYSTGGKLAALTLLAILHRPVAAAASDAQLPEQLVRGLLRYRVRGVWRSTSLSTWAILAGVKYFAVAEAVPPETTVRAWVGKELVAAHPHAGRSVKALNVDIPMRALLAMTSGGVATVDGTALAPEATMTTSTPTPVIIHSNGAGRVYYRLAMKTAPASPVTTAASFGISIKRRVRPWPGTDSEDVTVHPDGSITVRLGARVQVTIEIASAVPRYNIGVVCPVPGGLEAPSRGLAGLQSAMDEPENPPLRPIPFGCGRPIRGGVVRRPIQRRPWSESSGFDRVNLRTDRVEAFALFFAAKREFTFEMRATNLGTFRFGPATVSEIFSPEIHGRSDGTSVTVVE